MTKILIFRNEKHAFNFIKNRNKSIHFMSEVKRCSIHKGLRKDPQVAYRKFYILDNKRVIMIREKILCSFCDDHHKTFTKVIGKIKPNTVKNLKKNARKLR